MKNKTYGEYFNNPVVLVLLLILIVVGGYLLFNTKLPNEPITTETQSVASTSSALNTQQTQVSNNDLFEKQQSCSRLLNDLENRLKTENYKSTDFIVGYSPTLNACISGYTAKDSNNNVILYTIVNLNTNQDILPAFLPTEYTKYEARLSELTDGQISK